MRHLFCLILLISTMSFPQSSNEIEAYLNSNGTITYYSDVIDRMYDFIEQEFQDQEVPLSVWTDLRTGKDDALTSVKNQILIAYESHFTLDEIRELSRFYTSETGKKILQQKPLEAGDLEKRDRFYNSQTGQKIQESAESLNTVLQNITESWSSGLYASAKAKLKELGYVKKQ